MESGPAQAVLPLVGLAADTIIRDWYRGQMFRSHPMVYRILDANVNRCAEGLRVVEEYVRFVREDPHLSALCKQLRHDLGTLVDEATTDRLHAMRDVAGDVGGGLSTESESQRVDLKGVVVANVKRVEQSLRSLEEYAKVVSPSLAADFESLRYRMYELERALSALDTSLQRLETARLYVLIDGRASRHGFRELVASLVEHGVDVLQLRDKHLSDRMLLDRAKLLHSLVRGGDTLFIMNDRLDLALAASADGVHLGQDDMPVREARRVLGPEALIGVSTHEIQQAREAVLEGANYIGCGPTFPSRTKTFEEFPGLQYLKEVRREISLPAFAIGGVGLENVEAVCQAGVFRVAVSSAVVNAPDPAQSARRMADRLRAASQYDSDQHGAES
ncbi:MAG: thiamine phosphate synthase [Pirellulaceae bacterium]